MRVLPRRSVSIATLLSLTLAIVVAALLAVFGVLTYTYEREERRDDLLGALQVSVDQLATGLVLPLWNLDDKNMQAVLVSAMSHREVFAIIVKSSEGKTYGLGRNADWAVGPLAAEPTDSALLSKQRTISHNGREIGRVRVLASTRFLEEDLQHRRRSIVLIIAALAVALIATLYLLLWHFLVKPLREVERFASSVKDSKPEDQARPAAPDSNRFVGELQTLATAVSDMDGAVEPDRCRPRPGGAEQVECRVGRQQLGERCRIDRRVGAPAQPRPARADVLHPYGQCLARQLGLFERLANFQRQRGAGGVLGECCAPRHQHRRGREQHQGAADAGQAREHGR